MKSITITFFLLFVSITSFAQTNYAMSLPGGSNGNNSNVALPDLHISSLPITIEAWVYPIAKNDYGGLFYYRGASTNGGIQFDKWTNPNTFRGIGNSGLNAIATNNVNFNEWNHVAWVVTSSGMTIYLNGVATSVEGTPNMMPFDSGIYIGWDAATDDRTIQGYFDEVRVWTTERTAQEIEDNKNKKLTGSEPELRGYWNFDDQASSATDMTGNEFNGTINGGTYITSSLTLGIEDTMLTSKSKFSFYTEDNTLHAVNLGSENVDYRLYTINGQLISKGKIVSNSVTDLGNYIKGLYIVQIDEDDKGTHSTKVLVQ